MWRRGSSHQKWKESMCYMEGGGRVGSIAMSCYFCTVTGKMSEMICLVKHALRRQWVLTLRRYRVRLYYVNPPVFKRGEARLSKTRSHRGNNSIITALFRTLWMHWQHHEQAWQFLLRARKGSWHRQPFVLRGGPGWGWGEHWWERCPPPSCGVANGDQSWVVSRIIVKNCCACTLSFFVYGRCPRRTC